MHLRFIETLLLSPSLSSQSSCSVPFVSPFKTRMEYIASIDKDSFFDPLDIALPL